MEEGSKNALLSFIVSTFTVGFLWAIGLFELVDLFFSSWVKYPAAFLTWLLGIGYSFQAASQGTAFQKAAYEDDNEDALETLKKRFAKGEIDEEEYRRKLEMLGGDNGKDKESTEKCPNCGEEIEIEKDFCTNCGEEL